MRGAYSVTDVTGDRSKGVGRAFLAAFAPETATSCHYFWNFVSSFRTDDHELTAN